MDLIKLYLNYKKSIVRHFNFCPLGVNILSMSKRIMNEVFCTAEDLGLSIFYQDSLHMFNKDIDILAKEFKKRYNRELIGKNLGQFHSDFAEITKCIPSLAYKSIFVGKKTYIDQLTNKNNEIAFHCRMKGIKQDVIAIVANELFPNSIQVRYNENKMLFEPIGNCDKNSEFSIMKLYERLYKGDEIEFDLCKSINPCFENTFDFTVSTKHSFIRKLKF